MLTYVYGELISPIQMAMRMPLLKAILMSAVLMVLLSYLMRHWVVGWGSASYSHSQKLAHE